MNPFIINLTYSDNTKVAINYRFIVSAYWNAETKQTIIEMINGSVYHVLETPKKIDKIVEKTNEKALREVLGF